MELEMELKAVKGRARRGGGRESAGHGIFNLMAQTKLTKSRMNVPTDGQVNRAQMTKAEEN